MDGCPGTPPSCCLGLDHEARRSQVRLLGYMLGQAGRVRGGPGAIAGNHVVIASSPTGPFILLAHLRRGSATVAVGDHVQPGDPVGSCGNSGNSTQPHVHIQATDSTDWEGAKGLPITFDHPRAPAIGRVRGCDRLIPHQVVLFAA